MGMGTTSAEEIVDSGAASGDEDADDSYVIASEIEAPDGYGDSSGGGGGTSSSHFMEGYTPLNFNMNALVDHLDSDDDDGDGGGDSGGYIDGNEAVNEEMDGELFADNGYYHMMGPSPPRRLNGVKDRVRVVGFADTPHGYAEGEDGASSHHTNSDNESSHSNDNSNASESVGLPDDFHLLAEQALRGLEVEHLSTLERSMDAVAATPDVSSDDTSHENSNVPIQSSTEFETCFPSLDDKNDGTNVKINEKNAEDLADTTQEVVQKIQPVATVIPTIQLKESKSMDVNAIQKAMKSIRLKSPQLATTLDAGASSSFATNAAHLATDAALTSVINSTCQAIEQPRQQQATYHTIIPAGPLAAFRRTSSKAQVATANLTRSATLSEAVVRLWPLICFRRRMRAMLGLGGGGLSPKQKQINPCSKTLTIHILGADGVECSSEDLVRKSVGSFVRWLDAALRSGALRKSQQDGLDNNTDAGMPAQPQLAEIDSLLIEFSGPNMPNVLLGKVVDLLPEPNSQSSGGLVSAKAVFQQREYHEVPSGTSDDATNGFDAQNTADLAVAFNAGIWGYDSWKPTIAFMTDAKGNGSAGISNLIGKTLFVITAYTVEECEDDAEVVAEVVNDAAAERSLSSGVIARQLWTPETNPFSSRLERKTASAPPGRKYFENGAWQAWLLGL